MKNLSLKLIAITVMLFAGFSLKAQTLTFTNSTSGGYVVAPGGGTTPCNVTVMITWTTMSGGLPVGHSLYHIFTPNETYSFTVLSTPFNPVGNLSYTFEVPCEGLAYGEYPKATVDAASSFSPNGGGETLMFISQTSGNHYTFFFESPDGVYP